MLLAHRTVILEHEDHVLSYAPVDVLALPGLPC